MRKAVWCTKFKCLGQAEASMSHDAPYTPDSCSLSYVHAMGQHSHFAQTSILPDYRYRYDREQSPSPLGLLEALWPAKLATLKCKALDNASP